MKTKEKYLNQKLSNEGMTSEMSSKAGLSFVLFFLFLEILFQTGYFYKIAFLMLILNLLAPKVLYPFTIMLTRLSKLIGKFISMFLLTFIYISLVVPVGVFRKIISKDLMQMRIFKKSSLSVMFTRNQTFNSTDIAKPY